jgi:diguanylate cyclase (GGDEF)-like protein
MRLRTQFFLVSAFVLISVVVVILAAVIPRWQEELNQGARQRGRAVISMLARVCAEPAMVGNYSELQRAIDDLAREAGVVYVAVIDRKGRVVVSSAGAGGKPFFALEEPPADPAGILSADLDGAVDAITRVEGREVMDFAAPLSVYRRSWGLARLGLSLQPIRHATAAVRQRMLWLGLAGLLLGGILVVLLAAGITRPLGRMVAATRSLGERRLDARVGLAGSRELVQLGTAFNQMADSLQRHIKEVEEKSSELEAGYRILTRLSTTIDREALMRGVLEVISEVLTSRRCELMALDYRRRQMDRFTFEKKNYRSISLSPADLGLEKFEDAPALDETARKLLHPEPDDLFIGLLVDEMAIGGLLLSPEEGHQFKESERKLARGISNHLMVALENARLYEMAIRDGLTGLTVRRYFLARLQEELDRAHRYKQPFCLLMIDIDHFKRVNDTRGHPAGDQVLRGMASRLKNELRSTDLLSRYGGEELVVLLPNQDRQHGYRVAEKLRQAAARRPYQAGAGDPLTLTVSVGVSGYPHDGDEVEILIAKADEALYAAKQAGRNLVRLAL